MFRFGHNAGAYAPSHTCEALSIGFANLPLQLKYVSPIYTATNVLILLARCQTQNMLVICIFPGPKGPNNEEVQWLLKPFVDDLIRLYEEGIIIKTPLYPEGEFLHYFYLFLLMQVTLRSPCPCSSRCCLLRPPCYVSRRRLR